MCWKPFRSRSSQTIKSYQVAPLPFTIDETIECAGCLEVFPLQSHKENNGIRINCAGCDKFFHCKIAGQCQGPHCNKKTSTGVAHRLSWCIDCVPKLQMNHGTCFCYKCFRVYIAKSENQSMK